MFMTIPPVAPSGTSFDQPPSSRVESPDLGGLMAESVYSSAAHAVVVNNNNNGMATSQQFSKVFVKN
jgi:hypothetical protein